MYHFCWNGSKEKMRVDQALTQCMPTFSRAHVQRHLHAGNVLVNGTVVTTLSYKVSERDEILLKPLDVTSLNLEPVALPFTVVYEDEALLVLDKPAGLVVHPGAGTKEPTLVHGLLHHCQGTLSGIGGVERPGIVHRLDKETSGLMVVAKTDQAHRGLSEQFQTNTLKRTYWAFVYGLPNPYKGEIRGNIGRDSRNRKKMQVRSIGGKEAVTHYEVKESYWAEGREVVASLVECRLETGRTHQIRVHMLAKGHGVLGDTTYVSRSHKRHVLKRLLEDRPILEWQEGRQALHAKGLKFIHPLSGKLLKFRSELPADLQALHHTLSQANDISEDSEF